MLCLKRGCVSAVMVMDPDRVFHKCVFSEKTSECDREEGSLGQSLTSSPFSISLGSASPNIPCTIQPGEHLLSCPQTLHIPHPPDPILQGACRVLIGTDSQSTHSFPSSCFMSTLNFPVAVSRAHTDNCFSLTTFVGKPDSFK